MQSKSRKEYEAEVRSWGFPHVFTWTDGPYVNNRCRPDRLPTSWEPSNAHYSPHSHSGLTTHLILKGQLTITYPNDAQPEKNTFSVGDRIDVEAGRVHEVWMGADGCTYVIGE
ncbi:RmlC-like cupin [Apiospora hydei]|uniref:RmlC-like cupin n=1 Tax=Apiospora hydei TaxID=1337664 RepID=A0ABR1VTV4_9PEZI